MANNTLGKTTAPLAGRPPFATDEPDSAYENSPNGQTRRLRFPDNQDNKTRPTSAYDVYDHYIDEKNPRQSGYGDLGADLLNGELDDDSDDETIAYHGDIKKDFSEEKLPPPPSLNNFPAIPIMAPKPGYAAPVSALTMPEPVASPIGQQRSHQQQMPQPQMRQQQKFGAAPLSIPERSPYAASPVPSTPHPLQPPMTPITPAFARPPKSEGGVKFDAESIIRGQREEVPLARRGQKGDDFWRRFSMVVREEGGRKNTSSWLEKTQNGSAHLSRMVWIIGILILVIIGGAIGFGWYISHNSTTTTHAKALGGSEGQGQDLSITQTSTAAGGTSSEVVRPTLTVQKRWPVPEPTPASVHVVHVHPHANAHYVPPSNSSKRHRRTMKNRLV